MSKLIIDTELGKITILLYKKEAPMTSEYFEMIANQGAFENSHVFRIVNDKNATMRTNAQIQVVQLGINNLDSEYSKPLEHESTDKSGLNHKKWTVSAARYDVGQNYPSFFICMRDEPELDHGGNRHPDRQGFAVFGKVINGFNTVEAIYAKAEAEEYLKNPIEIYSIDKSN